MNIIPKTFTLIEVCQSTGLNEETIFKYIENEWIVPPLIKFEKTILDEDDLARIHLILELRNDLGVNDDAIPIILHLIDQIHYMRSRLKSGSY